MRRTAPALEDDFVSLIAQSDLVPHELHGLGYRAVKPTRMDPDRTTNTDCSTSICRAHRAVQISQSVEFKALRKPPNALSRQGSVSLAAFEGWEIALCLVTVAFSDLGRAAVVTFFDLGLCR